VKAFNILILYRKNVLFEWLVNCRISLAKVANLLGQERRFQLSNPIILQTDRSKLKFPGPQTAFWCVLAYFNPALTWL